MNQLQRCGRWPARWWAAGQAGGQGGTRPSFRAKRPPFPQWPAVASDGQRCCRQSLESQLSMLIISGAGELVLGSLRGRGSPWLHHDNTAPKQLMTAAEMKQALADIRMDAKARLQEIREQIAQLAAEADQLQELING